MSHENASPEMNEQSPKEGWSTKKKWIVGCGGCLGVVLVFVIGFAVLAGMGINSVMQASNQAVENIFGTSYKPNDYVAMGLPVNNRQIKALAMLIGKQKSALVFAFQTQLPTDQLQLLQSGQIAKIQPLLKKMADDAITSTQSSSSAEKMRSLRLSKIYNKGLTTGKVYTACNAIVEVEKRGGVSYAPVSVAVLPESGNDVVILALMSTKDVSTSAETDFTPVHEEMQQQVLQLIKDSELDDRIGRATTAKPAQ